MQPSTTTATAPRSRGSALLGKVDATQDAIAEKTGTSRQAVAKWLSAESRPSPPIRKKLWRHFKVPVASWDEATTPKVARPPAATAQPEVESLLAEDPETGDGSTMLARAEQLDAWCRRALAFLQTAEVDSRSATIADKLSRIIKEVAGLRGELDVSKRILKLPEFQRAVRTITEAVKGHPDAAIAIAKALRCLENP